MEANYQGRTQCGREAANQGIGKIQKTVAARNLFKADLNPALVRKRQPDGKKNQARRWSGRWDRAPGENRSAAARKPQSTRKELICSA
jgi:hypothetical protein